MKNFIFDNNTKIVFGKEAEDNLIDYVKTFGTRILIHYGGQSATKSGLISKIKKLLGEAGMYYCELSGVKPNPRLELVQEGIEICKKNGIDFILAVGGGSVIDSAKAIALGSKNSGDVWDFYLGNREAQDALPVGVILTIAAAGSESSNGSVITNEGTKLKKSYASPLLYPKFAILNPEYTFTLPQYQTACGAVDIMAHVMERYFTNTRNTDLSDRLCEATMITVIENAPLALENPSDYNARAEIMWSGTIAHNNLLGMGRVEDWGSHQIEHEISAIYDIAHGAGLAIVIPAWMKYTCKTNISRFVQYAQRVWKVDFPMEDEERIILEGIRRMENFFKSLGMPVSLKEVGIRDESVLDIMAEKCTANGPVGNLKYLYKEDVRNILEMAR